MLNCTSTSLQQQGTEHMTEQHLRIFTVRLLIIYSAIAINAINCSSMAIILAILRSQTTCYSCCILLRLLLLGHWRNCRSCRSL